MFGIYENFPNDIHGKASFTCQYSPRRNQQTILRLLHRLTQENYDLNKITLAKPENLVVSFEFGVAEGNGFNFLDKEELERACKTVAKQKLPVLDFFCAVRYYRVDGEGKRLPLKFDYYMLRFFFKEHKVELFFAHQRGTMRIPVEDLASFLSREIGKEFLREKLKPIKPEGFIKFLLVR